MPVGSTIKSILSIGLATVFLAFTPITQATSEPSAVVIDLERNQLQLTQEEQIWLKKNPVVNMCVDPNWMPYEKITTAGKHVGIAADYIRMFAQTLGLEINLITTKTWSESEEYAQARKCDILSMLNQSEKRAQYLNFTSPYIEAPVVLVAHDNVTYIDGLKSLSGKTFAMVKDYVYEDTIRQQYPDIDIVYVKSMDDGLKKISSGQIYATIGSLYIITSQLQKLGLTDLKIAGHTEITNQFRIGVRNDNPMLLQVFEKAVSSRDNKAENEILRHWISVKMEQKVDYTLLWQVLVAAGIVISLVIYRQILISRYNQKLKEKNAELEYLSRVDTLTGVFNRAKIDEMLSYQLDQAQRFTHGFALIVLDIDHFKQINDTYGHQSGDQVLIGISQLINQHIRKSDTFGRWGGEEFIIICPESGHKQASILAEKLRQELELKVFTEVGQVTASFGIAQHQENDQAKDIIARADTAMYQAKVAGRNQVKLG